MSQPPFIPTSILRGKPGRDGQDGSNVLPTDEAIAAAIADVDSETTAALSASIADSLAALPGAGDGKVLTVQGDGSVAYETPSGGGGGGSARADIAAPADRTGLRAGLKAILDGTRDASWMFVGDSTTYGIGSTDTVAPNDSFPTKLIALLDDTTSYAVGEGWVRPPNTQSGFTDPRWAFGTGWTAPNQPQQGAAAVSGASGVLAFTPGETATAVEILYAQNSGKGSSVVKNGASTIGTINGAGANQIAKVTYTFSSGTPTINIAGPTGGDFIVYAVRVTNTAARKIRITNGGWPSAKVADFVSNGFTNVGDLADAVDPDVMFIGLNKNDGTTPTTFATWQAGIITLVTRYLAAGNTVCLLMETPSDPGAHSGITAREALEAAALKQIAAAYGCGFIDLRVPFGTYSVANGAGLYSDDVHPSTAGYAVNAQQVADWGALAVAP